MQSLEKKDLIKRIRVIKPAKCILPNNEIGINRDKKFIVDEDNRILQLTSIDADIISNESVWDASVGTFDKRGIKYFVDPVNSYADDSLMYIHIVFLDAELWDGESKINLSMWLSNSYDKTIAFKFRFGTYRWTCANGAVMGYKVLSAKHYRSDWMKRLNSSDQIGKATQYALQFYPQIQERINELRTVGYTPEFKASIEKTFGIPFKNFMLNTDGWKKIITAYDLYLHLTWWVTHYVHIRRKEKMYEKISKAFEL